MSNYSIRLATIEDLPELRQLWRDLVVTMQPTAEGAYPRDTLNDVDDWTRSVAREFTKTPATGFLFVAERDKRLLGFLLYEIQHRLLGEPKRFAYCHHLFVRPEGRGMGIGPALSEVYLEHALAQGLEECEASYAPDATWVRSQPYLPWVTRCHASIGSILAHFDKRRAHHAALAATVGNGHDRVTVTAEPAKEPSDDRDDG
jgi:GNAT superfamily N-acetyltransferase